MSLAPPRLLSCMLLKASSCTHDEQGREDVASGATLGLTCVEQVEMLYRACRCAQSAAQTPRNPGHDLKPAIVNREQ